MPSCRRPTLMLSLSNSRITIDWPWLVGSTLTRRSSSFSPTRDLDPPVLGAAALGDVDFGQNLDTRQDRPQQPLGGRIALHQHAIDPVADPDAVFERLDVDVRGPGFDRLGDDHLHQADDRRAGFVELFLAGAGICRFR